MMKVRDADDKKMLNLELNRLEKTRKRRKRFKKSWNKVNKRLLLD